MDAKDLDYLMRFLSIILGLGVAFTIIFALTAKKEIEPKLNSVCQQCNAGHYQFVQAVGHQGPTTYIIECDNCGSMREVRHLN